MRTMQVRRDRAGRFAVFENIVRVDFTGEKGEKF